MLLYISPKLGNYRQYSFAWVNQSATSHQVEPVSNSQPLGHELSTVPEPTIS